MKLAERPEPPAAINDAMVRFMRRDTSRLRWRGPRPGPIASTVTEDGRVQAIVVGVGGFLGIGEKPVALAWDSVKLTEQDGSRVILVSATREQLEGMPTYKTLEDKQAEADAAAAQQQMQQQQQQGAVPSPGVAAPAPAPAPAPQPGNQ